MIAFNYFAPQLPTDRVCAYNMRKRMPTLDIYADTARAGIICIIYDKQGRVLYMRKRVPALEIDAIHAEVNAHT